MQPTGTFVDPRVSRSKFDREVASYRAREEEHQRRGWWMLKAEFPEVFAVFATPQAKPPSVVFGAVLDFRNYDLWPPSVTLVEPFTRVPYKAKELPYKFLRRNRRIVEQQGEPGPTEVEEVQTLMQAWGLDENPFLCLPGVREYHDNPGHSGDQWLMHRRRGEGTLFFIFDQLYRYGIAPIRGLQFRLAGYAVEVPE